jgi:iron(III) transport system substrate-binding protein
VKPRFLVLLVLVSAAAAACSGDDATLTVYTSVTQETVDAVVTGFEAAGDTEVEVFRAPTGELTARIEAERRSGEVGADVLWLTDPLSMYQYDADGLLAAWEPDAAASLDAGYVEPTFWGTRVLDLVLVVAAGNPHGVDDWDDLTDPGLRSAIPDPRFAGSAFAALGYFGLSSRYGMDFFSAMKDAGTVQVAAPGDVVTGVAEGRFDAGLTLEFSARTAADKGSPVEVVWPVSGSIAVTSPIAVVDGGGDAAEDFVEYVLSPEGQAAIGSTGWTPVLDSAPGPRPPAGTSVVFPDWDAIFDAQAGLVDDYTAIFGG